jgi:hypothetical protein
MTDNYMVTLDDISKDIKVGNRAQFSGSCGVKIDKIEIFVDGFKIGEAKILTGAGPLTWNSWTLEYVFTNGGHRSLVLTAKSKGEVVLNRFHKFDVEPEVVVEPSEPVKKKFPVTIVESKVRHVTRWNNDLVGVCWHYDAARLNNDPTGTLKWGAEQGYTFWSLTPAGVFHSTTTLREFGYHNGMYRHKNHLGVEINSPGLLTKVGDDFWPWYALKNGVPRLGEKPWPKDQIRYFEGSKTQVKGHYAKFTQEQEDAMFAFCHYLKEHCPKFKIENVVSHDECMTEMGWYGEKQDVGGSLSMTMEEFRARLKEQLG